MSIELLEPSSPGPLADPGLDEPAPPTPTYRKVLTALVAFVPLVVGVIAIASTFGHAVPWRSLVLVVALCALVGHGVTIGFHRLFAHRSFEARRPLKIALALAGSLSFQGSLIGWVADHRRHHRYSDRPDDPHSPYWRGEEPRSGWRGLWHAHLGWCFGGRPTSRERYTPDLLADPDLVLIDRLFVPCCVVSLAIPFAIGYLWSGALGGALSALVWAGIIRIGITHNFTWSVNSIGHRFGKRPYDTRDHSTNVAALSIFTMGESWHNNHHAFPRSARHGIARHQLDSSARLIRWFELLGWATNVSWPDPAQLDTRRV